PLLRQPVKCSHTIGRPGIPMALASDGVGRVGTRNGRDSMGVPAVALCSMLSASGVDGKDADRLAAPHLPELDLAVDKAEQGVVLALADVLARVELRAALAHEDRSGGDLAASEGLHAEALSVGIATVAG